VKAVTFRAAAGTPCSGSLDCTGIPGGFYRLTIDNGGKVFGKSKICLTR
jgi:hypothetical protein